VIAGCVVGVGWAAGVVCTLVAGAGVVAGSVVAGAVVAAG
jgi:hypothetical protein